MAIGVLVYGGQSLAKVWTMKQEVEALERELVALRGETEALGGQIDRLRTDPDYVEQLARESLGMVKPGERVFKLPRTPGG
jgi:cell division protein FtsB